MPAPNPMISSVKPNYVLWAGRKPAMLMRLSVPAQGGLRELATEVAARIAEYLGSHKKDAPAIVAAIDGLAGRVAPPGECSDITFEFSEEDRALLIRARCDGRSSEARCALPS